MNITKYFKTTKVGEFLNETIGKGKTNKKTADLLNISPLTINRYNKAIGIKSNRKIVKRTTEEKHVSILKSMKTKATNKLIKEEIERIKSLPADQQLIKIEEFKTKYNISSARLNAQTESGKGIKGKDKMKKNLTEMNEQQGKGKDNELHNSLSDMTISSNKVQASSDDKKINNSMIYSGDTKDLSALLSKNPNPAINELLQKKKQLWINMVWE